MRSRAPSPATITLLAALLQQPQAYRHGYDLMKATGLESGTLYPILARLNDRGLLHAEWRQADGDGKPPRHAYRLTKVGIAYANEHTVPQTRARAARRQPA